MGTTSPYTEPAARELSRPGLLGDPAPVRGRRGERRHRVARTHGESLESDEPQLPPRHEEPDDPEGKGQHRDRRAASGHPAGDGQGHPGTHHAVKDPGAIGEPVDDEQQNQVGDRAAQDHDQPQRRQREANVHPIASVQ